MINRRGLIAGLTGHTDNVGKRELNLTLSEYRTRVAASYLQQKGIQWSRLSPTWKGPDSSMAPNDSEETRLKTGALLSGFCPVDGREAKNRVIPAGLRQPIEFTANALHRRVLNRIDL